MSNTTMKYSRQREAIRQFLLSRKDHPTADVVYENVKKEFPHISLGTVYRNLSLMVARGEALKFPGIDGFDHFDGTTVPHYHFICEDCHAVMDLALPSLEQLNIDANRQFDGEITSHQAFFYGRCAECANKHQLN